ncbi:uncharacterized protein EDB91DRAFT_303794 [Suillus paluster]|uniref:uncharacterized protein n=1 Tax=Suillus paluster TaxID=48578 RepID=UPI001B886D98|nr:uncharacterized protein EDB91DRAFT_303794 [Suillus paluster]KAG1742260.1 hypothetical protein EDB91DRAFT_303794 [Suillus paluster]
MHRLSIKKRSEELATLAREIVACCPELRYLAGDSGSLCSTSNMSLPEYPYLRELKVSGQNPHLLAPLLPRLCNLESFKMIQSHGDGDFLGHYLMCKWLLESSLQSIESLEVQEIGVSQLGDLAAVIGGFVTGIHVKSLIGCPSWDDSTTIVVLSRFAGLRRLRIDGIIFKTEYSFDLQSSLEAFTITKSFLSMRIVVELLYMHWQSFLQSLNVYGLPW